MSPRALLTLTVVPERYAICRLAPEADVPQWSMIGAFISISRTPDELSIVCPETSVPAGVTCEPGWRILKCEGPLDYGLTGIIASLAEPLADAGVPIFPIATHDTDYILVKEPHLETAINALTTYATPSEPDFPKLYGELASWFHLLSSPPDYAEEAEFARSLIVDACPTPVTVLELGSGGGNNASHLKTHFRMTLVDISQGMLELSLKLNPECEHIRGDMKTLRLGRTFDAVFIHDAIMYMINETDLRLALETASVHCKVGGVLLVMPDVVKETFVSLTTHGGHDSKTGDGRAIRYIEWTFDTDPSDTTYTVDFAYLLREANQPLRAVHDTHVFGIFSRETWRALLHSAGFAPRMVTDPWGREVFVAKKLS
jgi:SAM-dependent methyltransferase